MVLNTVFMRNLFICNNRFSVVEVLWIFFCLLKVLFIFFLATFLHTDIFPPLTSEPGNFFRVPT